MRKKNSALSVAQSAAFSTPGLSADFAGANTVGPGFLLRSWLEFLWTCLPDFILFPSNFTYPSSPSPKLRNAAPQEVTEINYIV